MRNIKYAFLVLTAIVLASCATVEKRKEAADIHYKMGVVHFGERKYSDALKDFTEAARLDPGEPLYHNMLGMTYFAKGINTEAVEHLKEATALNHKYSEAHLNLGAVYIELKKWDLVIEESKAVLADVFYRTPELAHNNMGWAYYNKGEYRSAIESFKKAVELNKSYAMPLYNSALAHEKMGRADDARAAYEAAVGTDPTFYEAHYNLGVLLMKAGDKAGAKKAFSRVVELAPRSALARSASEYMGLLK